MLTTASDNTNLRQASNTLLRTVQGWLKGVIEARRAKWVRARRLDELRHLDPSVLEDIGIDLAGFNHPGDSLSRYNPYVTAMRALIGPNNH